MGHLRKRAPYTARCLDRAQASTNRDAHVDNGRAYNSGGCYYAEGSDQYLGCMGTTDTTLEETSTGYYEEVSSC
ncbi:MAG: hypothetical protein V5A45_02710 [Haloarculaceae archaeon]